MTQKTASQYLPIIQAWADGKTIQVRVHRSCDWYDATTLDFNRDPECYRIKPEPKLREWNQNTAPVGALIRRKSWQNGGPSQILAASGCGVRFYDEWRDEVAKNFSFQELLNPDFEHSIDGGKTWLPCGVVE